MERVYSKADWGGGGVMEGGRQTVAVGQGIGWQCDSIGWE